MDETEEYVAWNKGDQNGATFAVSSDEELADLKRRFTTVMTRDRYDDLVSDVAG